MTATIYRDISGIKIQIIGLQSYQDFIIKTFNEHIFI